MTTCGSVSNWWNGGGDGRVHSRVVAGIALTAVAGSAGSALCGISEPGGEHSQSMDGARTGRGADR
jgi:hypothetical protein